MATTDDLTEDELLDIQGEIRNVEAEAESAHFEAERLAGTGMSTASKLDHMRAELRYIRKVLHFAVDQELSDDIDIARQRERG